MSKSETARNTRTADIFRLSTIFHFFCHLLKWCRAIIFFLVNCSKIKNHEKSSAVHVFQAVSLLDNKYQLFENQMLDKGGGKCQLLDTIYSKENGVHVRQLG